MNQNTPYLAGFGLALVAGAGAFSWAAAGYEYASIATMAGAALLGCSQIALLGLVLRNKTENDETLGKVRTQTSVTMTKVDKVMRRFEEVQLENRQQSQTMIASLEDVRQACANLQVGFASLQNSYQQSLQPQAVQEHPYPSAQVTVGEAAPAFEQPVAAAAAPVDITDMIGFELEPIVDTQTNRTAHYRLHVAMATGQEQLKGEALYHYVDEAGMRAQLDYLGAYETLGLLARLRSRDPDLCIFMRLGIESLRNADVLQRILQLHQGAGRIGQGLVIEINHSDLGAFGEVELEGLATLARGGMIMGLSQCAVSGLDLEAMKSLNIRHVGISAVSIDENGPSLSLMGFAQVARISNIAIHVSDVAQAALVPKLPRISRLACGPAFAAPRAVKRVGALEQELAQQAQVGLAA